LSLGEDLNLICIGKVIQIRIRIEIPCASDDPHNENCCIAGRYVNPEVAVVLPLLLVTLMLAVVAPGGVVYVRACSGNGGD
jgi:hypothetical protein